MEKAIAVNPGVRIVVLDSPGGFVDEGIRIGHALKQSGLATGVDHRCASACTLAFAAGKDRILLPPGRLGFHGCHDVAWYSYCNIAESEDYLVANGVDVQFVRKAMRVDPRKIWYPDTSELLAARVVTSTAIRSVKNNADNL